jgi:DNA-binding NtrC family response regulator
MARILLADDDDNVRAMLRASLERMNHTVIEASNGKTAVTLYQQEKPDLVLTDLIMPEKDGIETILELMRHHSDAKIIAMSAGGRLLSVDYLRVAKKLGAIRVLSKPFTTQVLADAIDGVLNPNAESAS